MPSSRLPMSWSRWIDRAWAVAAVLAFFVFAGVAQAEDPAACGQFKWPLATEISWFDAGNLKKLPSDAAAGEAAGGAFTATLKPSAGSSFALPPEGKPKPDKPLGTIISFATVATPGLSGDALGGSLDRYRPGWRLSPLARIFRCPWRPGLAQERPLRFQAGTYHPAAFIRIGLFAEARFAPASAAIASPSLDKRNLPLQYGPHP